METFIDIPFGSQDSELIEWAYTIPEGMEAEIKDGKVIIKRKENEDSLIKRAIIHALRVYGKTQGEFIYGYDIDSLVFHLRNADFKTKI